VQACAMPEGAVPESQRLSENLDDVIGRRLEFLTAYQNATYAARYANRVARVKQAEVALGAGTALTETVARSLFKLMAYKDEYEVARLYTDSDFLSRIAGQFEGPYRLHVHLAPPLLAERDPASGHLKKRAYGPWMLTGFRLLARLRFLRGTAFDPFGYTAERRTERQLLADYEAMLDEIAAVVSPDNHALAIELAALPLEIRGFGHVKEASRLKAKAKETALLARFRSPAKEPALAAE